MKNLNKLSTVSFSLVLVLLATLAGSVHAKEDKVVAVVGDHEILQSQVNKQINSVPLAQQIDVRGDPERFIESIINEETLFQFGLQLADQEPDWRAKLKEIVVRALLTEQVGSNIEVSDKAVKEHYEEKIVKGDREHIRVRHVAFANSSQCKWAADQISSAKDVADLASLYHSNPVFGKRGGDLGYLMRSSTVLGFESEVFDLPVGKLHRINKADVCHLIWITERRTHDAPPFDELKDRLRRQLEQVQQSDRLKAILARARGAVTVERQGQQQ